MVTDFYEKKIIAIQIKIVALTMMWTMLLVSITFFMPFIFVKVVVIAIGIAATIYITSFPSK